ncbi:ATP synthase subunit beta [Frankliniella fusca]|uniref:ATP synthase subunit beta n=1 Tax=Frankliniella fusca TaxID=407009 RepID=A0AAE1LV70_9NEOP|nr:ATP synthase subunit beta [Frankliniella fusca]
MTPHRTACLLSRGVVWKKFTGQSHFQLYRSTRQFSSPIYVAAIFSGEHDKQSTHSPAFSLARGQQWNEVPRQDFLSKS